MVEFTEDDVVELTRELVNRPSENPCGNELEVANFIEQWLTNSEIDFDIEKQFVEEDRPNVICRAGNPAKGTLLLTGHMDVVPATADAWDTDPFQLQEIDGQLIGRGVSDMKGALAAKLLAAEHYLRNADNPGEVKLAFVVNEERGGGGTKALVERGIVADGAIIGEPTQLHACIAEKGVVRYKIRIHGKSAHSGRPEKGINSISSIPAVLSLLADLHDEMQEHEHPLLTPGSVTPTVINGGTVPNIVPDTVTITVDWRTVPNPEYDQAYFDDKMSTLESAFNSAHDQVNISSERIRDFASGAETDPDDPVVNAIVNAAAEVDIDCRRKGFNAGSDARIFSRETDIPTVLFGPGSIEEDAHTVHESIAKSDLFKTAVVYTKTLERFFDAIEPIPR